MTVQNKLEVGAEVEAMCKTCKGPSIHVIEVIKNDKITKVMCKACLNSHRYVPVSEAEEATKPKTAKRKTPLKTKEERKWSRLLSKVDSEQPIEYEMDKSFTEKDVINHAKFGVGVVVEVVDRTKISVAFQQGMKTLVQNR